MSTPPNRLDVDRRWTALVEARLSREDVSAWTIEWVEDRDEEIEDPMVRNGLQHFHGFGLMVDPLKPTVVTHGRGVSYIHSCLEIKAQLARWRANCALYDADPEAYSRAARDRALENLHRTEHCGDDRDSAI